MHLVYKIPLVAMTKKNHHQIISTYNKQTGKKKMALIPSSQYKQFETDCGWFLNPIPNIPINSPINIKYSFYMNTMRRVDVLNLCEGMDDILVRYKIIEDDNCKIVVSHDGTRVYYDKENPRIEVEITDAEATFFKLETKQKERKSK